MVSLIDRPDMTIDVYRGRKTTKQKQILSELLDAHTAQTTFKTFLEYILTIAGKVIGTD